MELPQHKKGISYNTNILMKQNFKDVGELIEEHQSRKVRFELMRYILGSLFHF